MGLDSYLYKKTYLYKGENVNPEYKAEISLKIGGKEIDTSKITYVVEEAAYWRKANQIHRWFVENVQHGNDDGGSYYVSRDELEELLGICKEVIADPSKAEDLLPTQSGFFFGPTAYDDYYLGDVENTIHQLEEVLSDEKSDEFEYYASW